MSSEILRIVGKRIEEVRKTQGLTQQELGDAIGVSRQRIGQYEKGERILKIDRFSEIAKTLNVSMSYLLNLSNVSSTDKDLRFVCEYMGIDEESVVALKNMSQKLGNEETRRMLLDFFKIIEVIANG